MPKWIDEKVLQRYWIDCCNNYKVSDSSNNVLANVSGFDYVGRNNLYAYGGALVTHRFEMHDKNKHEVITVEFDGDLFTIKSESGDTVVFDLTSHILGLRKQGSTQIKTGDFDKLTLTQDSKEGMFKARLLLKEIGGEVTKDDTIDITNAVYVFMLKKTVNGAN